MKNPDRYSEHARRREAGDDDQTDTSVTDGRAVAEALYGGLPTDSEKIDDEADAEHERT